MPLPSCTLPRARARIHRAGQAITDRTAEDLAEELQDTVVACGGTKQQQQQAAALSERVRMVWAMWEELQLPADMDALPPTEILARGIALRKVESAQQQAAADVSAAQLAAVTQLRHSAQSALSALLRDSHEASEEAVMDVMKKTEQLQALAEYVANGGAFSAEANVTSAPTASQLVTRADMLGMQADALLETASDVLPQLEVQLVAVQRKHREVLDPALAAKLAQRTQLEQSRKESSAQARIDALRADAAKMKQTQASIEASTWQAIQAAADSGHPAAALLTAMAQAGGKVADDTAVYVPQTQRVCPALREEQVTAARTSLLGRAIQRHAGPGGSELSLLIAMPAS